MHPLLTLTTGIIVGAAAVRLAKSANVRRAVQATASSSAGKARERLGQAQSTMRGATVSGLEAIEKTSATLRQKLENTPSRNTPIEGSVSEENSSGRNDRLHGADDGQGIA